MKSSFGGFFGNLFDTANYPPRWECGSWSSFEGWLHIISDIGIFSAYFAIPCAILYFVRKRKDIPFNSIFFLFATFILFCGTGHLLEAIIFYFPIYRIAGVLKFATAVVSWATFLVMLKLLPKALELPKLATINEQLRLADASKSTFLANMSHEIRTPMTAILGYADTLLELDDKQERQQAVQTIKRNGEHLLAVINDILDISKIDAGQMSLELLTCRPRAIVEEVVALLQVRAEEKGLQISCTVEEDVPELVRTDPTRLKQVLINVIGNAVKFTDSGQIDIRLNTHQDGADHQLWFTVRDSGMGIAPEQQHVLFRHFSQGNPSVNRTHGGSGLGLAICKHLVEMMGGTINYSANPDQQGSIFTIVLPVEPGLAEARKSAAASRPGNAHSNPPALNQQGGVVPGAPFNLQGRILLAEDGQDNQRLFKFILQKAGLDVVVADNGRAALDILRQQSAETSFDLILMDMQMPVLDGYAATRELRAQGYSGTIVALTAHAMRSDRDKCLDAGCDDYLTKPIDKFSLLTFLSRHLPAAQETPPPDAAPAEPASA